MGNRPCKISRKIDRGQSRVETEKEPKLSFWWIKKNPNFGSDGFADNEVNRKSRNLLKRVT